MAQLVAKIAISKAIYAIDKPYDYLVPLELESTLQAGVRVLVPFGRGDRGSDGLVLSIEPAKTYEKPLKFILAQLDETPVLNGEALALASWMRSMYYCTVYDTVRAMLPAGLFFALKDTLILNVTTESALIQVGDSASGEKLINLLASWGGQGDIQQIRLAFGTKNPTATIRQLLNNEILRLESSAKRNVGDKSDKVVHLSVTPEDALAQVTPRRKSSPLRFAIIELLCQIGSATEKELCYYTGATPATVKSLVKSQLVVLTKEEVLRSPHKEFVPPEPKPALNSEQEAVFRGLLCLSHKATAALLYGITGSGKTQVYISLIHEILAQGRTAMVLVPEIALTPQLLRIFTAQFGEKIAILHSGLRIGERYDEWKRVKRGEASVVLGTRSAVFAPLENIGVIILDEEQEASYKSEQTPRYHARDIAKYRCVHHNALLVLGSATPSVDSMYGAKSGKYHLFTLKNRYNQGDLPQVTIVDMKDELRNGNRTCISQALLRELKKNRKTEEQCILFLNRRGKNRMLTCGDCGFVSECPNCSIRLTYHGKNDRLMCHYCNFSHPRPDYCPECRGILNYVGIGTQQVQDDLEEVFPQEKVLRMDTDTISTVHPHEEMFDTFRKENVPVLIGTQMVAKGLDFENVTLVGVVSADLSLYVDDVWAGERTFSLITQVVGRAGRGGKLGRAIIQTYNPDNDVILSAAKQDYDGFYEQEILLRQFRRYPPFREIIHFSASGSDENKVLQTLRRIRYSLDDGCKQLQEDITLLGPAPAAVVKVNNRFRYQITIIAQHSKGLRLLLERVLSFAGQDKDNKTVSIHIDRLIH